MKSRTSEKPTSKTKSTTAAKSVKKPAKKSVRASATKTVATKGKTTTVPKRKTTAKSAPSTKISAKKALTKPVEAKTTKPKAASPQPEPAAPPMTPPQAGDQVLGEESPLASTPPVFVKRDLTGPDGSKRPGWEMWIGDHCFGRADSKDLLLASFERLQSPPSSFHWREVRNRMPMRGRPKGASNPKGPAQVEGGEETELLDDVAEP